MRYHTFSYIQSVRRTQRRQSKPLSNLRIARECFSLRAQKKSTDGSRRGPERPRYTIRMDSIPGNSFKPAEFATRKATFINPSSVSADMAGR